MPCRACPDDYAFADFDAAVYADFGNAVFRVFISRDITVVDMLVCELYFSSRFATRHALFHGIFSDLRHTAISPTPFRVSEPALPPIFHATLRHADYFLSL